MYGKQEQLKYVNHLGEVLLFGQDGLFVNQNELRNFKWTVVSTKTRISGFKRETKSNSLPVRIACATEEQGLAKRASLFEIPEKDIVAMQYGKLYVGDYYCLCYITESKKTKYSISDRFMVVNLTVTTDKPYWIRENSYKFSSYDDPETGDGIDFPYDYAYDYELEATGSKKIYNMGISPAEYRVAFFGPVSNPSVLIDGHTIGINTVLGATEYAVIDSGTHTVYKVSNNGEITNLYNSRVKTNRSIFEKISGGEHSLAWSGTSDIQLTIYEERSEPIWT